MKKLFKYIIIGLLLFQVTPFAEVYAQTPQQNEEKYWEYRERLRNDFMIGIGPEMGMSTPASVRDTVSGILQWTDATMALGEYIGVLAMEFRILANRSVNTDETVEELFYALYALNRLDYNAELFFGGTPSLNGFFMRDDITEDSLDMDEVMEHLNQGLSTHEITKLNSDYMDLVPRNNEESLDQAILLITGLGLVKRCVPEEVVYFNDKEIQEFQDFETSLSLEAGHIINRIVNYMKEGDSVTVPLDPADANLYGIQGDAWDFLIKNPVTMLEVLRGPNAFFLSKGYTSAKYHLTGYESLTTDITSDTLANTIFLYMEYYILPNDQDFKAMNLEAMANYWPEGLQEDTAFTEYNAKILGPRSKSQSYEWIPMLHQLMFEGNKNYLISIVLPDTLIYNDPAGYYEYLINLAPPEGPYNYGDSLYPNWEWSSTSRTIQPGRRGEISNAFPGNYDGLDYMMYYNMFTLLFNDLNDISEPSHSSISIYPNPFRDQLRIKTRGNHDIIMVRIIDMAGKVVYSESFSGVHGQTLNLGSLAPGIYLLALKMKNNSYEIKKIVKQFLNNK
jgi:hypothetical protein